MSAFNFKTIIVKGDGIRKEGANAATVDVLPGMFVERIQHNFAVVKEAEANDIAKAVAVEQETFGTGIDVAYDTDLERVLYHVCPPGTEVFAWLAAGQNVDVGARLSVGLGATLVAATSVEASVALAMEDVDNSGGADPVRILVEIL